MTSATERIRAMLDERGVEWKAWDGTHPITVWHDETYLYEFVEYRLVNGAKQVSGCLSDNDGHCELTIKVFNCTPEQAIAATLGSCNVGRYVGLRQGEYWERTENSNYYCGGCGWKVTDHDSYCPECGGALHNATLGSCNCSNNCTNGERTETCHDKNGFDFMFGFECTVCGAMTDGYMLSPADTGHYKQFNFCPMCGRRIEQ